MYHTAAVMPAGKLSQGRDEDVVEQNGARVLDMMWESLQRVEKKLDAAIGDHERRIRDLEAASSEHRGVVRPFTVMLPACLGAIAGWLAGFLPGRG